jgi:hypothetical protein
MGLRVAVANGNWSNPFTWNGGVTPVAGDIVASNGFTVTIDQDVNVDSITNTVQTNYGIVPTMTSNTAPEGVAFSNSFSTGNEPYRAFDSPLSGQSYFSTAIPSVGSPIHLGYEFTLSKIVTKYSYSAHGVSMSYSPVDFTFEGWDGTTWVVLHTVVGHNAITYSSPTLSNTTSYLKYRLNVTKTGGSNFQISQLTFYDASSGASNSIAGGSFNLNSGVTVTLTGTNSITQGTVTVLRCNVTTGNTSTLIGNNFVRANLSNQPLIILAGAGTFNVTGTITYVQTSSPGITITGVNSTLNYTGDINSGWQVGGHGVSTDVVCTINVVGNITGGFSSNTVTGLRFNSAGVFTLVGTATGGAYGTNYGVYLNNTTATITGDLYGGNNYGGDSHGVQVDGNSSITITGTMYGRLSPAFRSSSNIYLNHYGTINCTGLAGIGFTQSSVALSSTGVGAINILTGPFISSPTGIQPLYVARMHYRRTIGSYYEFRDNTTNGALPPAGAAPATRLVSPDTVVDAPSPANVRFGTIYASGSQTGTMKVPTASNVRAGIEVDNTVGTAVLTASQIWEMLQSNLTTPGSIGERLKNCSTVQTTGSQIASL